MRFVMFYHSLISDWNHGNAHFLRGVVRELRARNHEVIVFEPYDGWSLTNLRVEQGSAAVRAFHEHFPDLESHQYEPTTLDVRAAVDGADVVLAHEWNDSSLINRLGRLRVSGPFKLLFHDT